MDEEPGWSFGGQVWDFHDAARGSFLIQMNRNVYKKTVTRSSGIQLLEEQKQFLSLWLNGLKKYYMRGTNWGEH